jgi:hypothetical protein
MDGLKLRRTRRLGKIGDPGKQGDAAIGRQWRQYENTARIAAKEHKDRKGIRE